MFSAIVSVAYAFVNHLMSIIVMITSGLFVVDLGPGLQFLMEPVSKIKGDISEFLFKIFKLIVNLIFIIKKGECPDLEKSIISRPYRDLQ